MLGHVQEVVRKGRLLPAHHNTITACQASELAQGALLVVVQFLLTCLSLT